MITTTDGVSLHVDDQGSGTPVILVAGFMAPTDIWTFQLDALLGSGYRVISVDRRSHGKSEDVAHGQRVARHGADLHEVITSLDLDDVFLVGSSMGASVIWSYLDQFGFSRVAGVVSVDQTPRMRNSPGWPYGYYGFTDDNAGTFFATEIPPTGRGLTDEAMLPGLQRLIARVGPSLPLGGDIPKHLLPLLYDHAQQDWRDVIARTAVPALLIAGRQSQLWPCEHAAALTEASPLLRAAIVEDAGHTTMIDQPDAVNAVLLSFLADR